MRSQAWSVLSGLSLVEMPVIAVVKLPLHEAELARFRHIASSSWSCYDTVAGEGTAYERESPLSTLMISYAITDLSEAETMVGIVQ